MLSTEAISVDKRSVKVNLNTKSSAELRKIAKELGMTETDVLRKGLALMSMYSEMKENEEGGQFLIKRGDTVREVIIA